MLGMRHTARGTNGAHGPPWGQNHLEGAMGSSRLHVAPSTSVAPSTPCQLRSGVWIPERQAARLSWACGRAASRPPGTLRGDAAQVLQNVISSNWVTWRPWWGRRLVCF